MDVKTHRNQQIMFSYFLIISLILIVVAFFAANEGGLISGWLKILTSPAALTVDYLELGGLGAAILNAGVMGFIVSGLFKCSKAELAAGSLSAFFLTVGFSLFGMNPLNVAPIIFGVFVYSKIKKEPFSKHVNASLFACAVAPFISELIFSYYIDIPFYFSIPIAVAVGIVIGTVFVPLLAHCVSMHKGHVLFNAGVAAGFMEFLVFAIYRTTVLQPLGVDGDYKLNSISSPGFPLFFGILFGAIFLCSIVLGIVLNKGKQNEFKRLLCHSGHSVDYIAHTSLGSVLINAGCLGAVFLTYFIFVGTPINGPVMGALLCIVACAASGSHLRNTLPILIGYILISFLATWKLEAQGMCVALCFATGMSPISGRYGYVAGVVAGALHACLVPFVAVIYGGLNLYNGGFTAGLVVIVLLPFLDAVFKDSESRKLDKMEKVK